MTSASFPRRTPFLALLVLSAAAAPASAADPVDVRALPAGAILEAYPTPELGQTILFARFPDERTEPVSVTIHDAEGSARATIPGAIEAGAAMIVWDGRGDDGIALPAGVYFATLVLGEATLSATFVVR